MGRDREPLIDWDLLCASIQSARQAIAAAGSLSRTPREELGDRLFAELFCREIDQRADRAELILAGVLAYVRGAVPFASQGSLHSLVEDARARLAARISGKRVRISADCDWSLLRVALPEERLRYIMDAALRIALALAPPGGRIQVRGTAPLLTAAGEPGASRTGSSAATLDFVIGETRVSPESPHAGTDGVPDAKSLGLAPEVLLLAEIAGLHGGGFGVLPGPEGRGIVLCLTLPVAGQAGSVPG